MYEPVKKETKEQYLRIWTNYAISRLNQHQLAEMFEVSEETISNAINWCAVNRLQFSPGVLLEAAKEAVETKIRELKEDLGRIKDTDQVNWNAAIGIGKLMQDYEEMLWQFQSIIRQKQPIVIDSVEILQFQKQDTKAKEERSAREWVDTLNNNQKRLFALTMNAIKEGKELFIEEVKNKGVRSGHWTKGVIRV